MIVWGGGASITNTNGTVTLAYTLTGARYDPVANSWVPMSTNGAPEVREDAQAVWTGSEMIVWGGIQIFDNSGMRVTNFLNTGGRYSPVTDSWQPLPTNGAPSKRDRHASVWTGSELFVWGGRDDTNNPANGARYSPSLNQWLPVSPTNAPPSRQSMGAVWTGNRVAVWGGITVGVGRRGDGALYDPATDTWETMNPTDAPEPRYWPSALVVSNELIIWAGFGTNMQVNTGGRYNLTTHQWTAMSTNGAPILPDTLVQPWHVSWDGNQMLTWGKLVTTLSTRTYGYHPGTDTWSTNSSRSLSTVEHSVVRVGDDLLIWGGASSPSSTPLAFGWTYSLVKDRWEYIPPHPVATRRRGHSAVWTGTEMIVWGGNPSGGTLVTNTGARYHPQTKTWSPTTTNGAPAARWGHSAAWTGTEMLIWGNANGTRNGGRYNPSTDTWLTMSTVNQPSGALAPCAVWTGSHWIIWGGRVSLAGIASSNGAIYEPATDTWEPISTNNAPSARWSAAAVWTGTEFIVWGGKPADSLVLRNGARYNPTTQTWTPISTVGAPNPLPRTIAVAVWTGTEMIVYGTEEENGQRKAFHYSPATDTWSQPSPEGVPSGPFDETLFAFWTGDRVLAFGGYRVEIYGNTAYANDSIPNDWQTQHFGRDNPAALADQDPDGDGRNNLFEFVTGTIPTRPDSFFQTAIALNTSNQQPAVVSFTPALTNRTYTLEWSTNISNWLPVSNAAPANNGPWTGLRDLDATNNARSYRISVSLP